MRAEARGSAVRAAGSAGVGAVSPRGEVGAEQDEHLRAGQVERDRVGHRRHRLGWRADGRGQGGGVGLVAGRRQDLCRLDLGRGVGRGQDLVAAGRDGLGLGTGRALDARRVRHQHHHLARWAGRRRRRGVGRSPPRVRRSSPWCRWRPRSPRASGPRRCRRWRGARRNPARRRRPPTRPRAWGSTRAWGRQGDARWSALMASSAAVAGRRAALDAGPAALGPGTAETVHDQRVVRRAAGSSISRFSNW